MNIFKITFFGSRIENAFFSYYTSTRLLYRFIHKGQSIDPILFFDSCQVAYYRSFFGQMTFHIFHSNRALILKEECLHNTSDQFYWHKFCHTFHIETFCCFYELNYNVASINVVKHVWKISSIFIHYFVISPFCGFLKPFFHQLFCLLMVDFDTTKMFTFINLWCP